MIPSRHLLAARCAGTFVASTSALAALWSATLPTPEWPVRSELSSLDSRLPDPTVLLTHGARLAASVLLGYLAVAGALNLLVVLCTDRVRLPSPVIRAAMRAPGWLRAASTGLVAGSALLSPTVAAAAPVPADPVGTVTMEVVTVEPASLVAHRSVLPWTALPSPSTAPPLHGSEPTTTLTTSPSSASDPSSTSLPDPPQLEPVPTEAPPQLIPPLVLERAPDGRPHEVAAPSTESPRATVGEHSVRPGEHFWAIAEKVVADRQLDVPVAAYWRLLIEANRSRLTDPADPNLLLPGQVLVLP